MVKLAVSVAFVLVSIAIVYGTLQAEDEYNGSDTEVATSTPVIVTPTPAPVATSTASPALSDILFTIRGGDDPCRFLYNYNRLSIIAEEEMIFRFTAGVWEPNLEMTNEMHLYGPNGPYRFEIVGPQGETVMSLDVDHGAQASATVTFPEVGMYHLYERLQPAGVVGEIFVRPVGQPGSVTQTEWCTS